MAKPKKHKYDKISRRSKILQRCTEILFMYVT